MGMGEFLYLQAGVGMGVGKILSGGYVCGWAIPNGFVPIAISTHSGGDGRAMGVGGAVPGHDSQARSGVDSPLTLRLQMSVP
jgi:hypothetical protein